MNRKKQTVLYDKNLHIETYDFKGLVQPFPNYFHEYYVIGLMENGQRRLSCKNRNYTISKGDIVLFNPRDNHSCIRVSDSPLDYRGFHISRETMSPLYQEITGRPGLPVFSHSVIRNEKAAGCLRLLHDLIAGNASALEKEETLLFLLTLLISHREPISDWDLPAYGPEIEKACDFIRAHYRERLCLEQICHCAGLSKSTLLRAFTACKGITPYCYLENVRIGKAKKLLAQGMAPVDAALLTGFSDQSHFSNCFRRFLGVSPGIYRDIFTHKHHSGGESHGI